jgi:glycosyltransferase involved in cell wall biosynthesis
MGKIVIGTERSSFEQLIEDRISGFLCERESPESNFSALKEALQMTEQEKQKMGEEAKKQIERLHPEEIYKNYLEYYEKVIREW